MYGIRAGAIWRSDVFQVACVQYFLSLAGSSHILRVDRLDLFSWYPCPHDDSQNSSPCPGADFPPLPSPRDLPLGPSEVSESRKATRKVLVPPDVQDQQKAREETEVTGTRSQARNFTFRFSLPLEKPDRKNCNFFFFLFFFFFFSFPRCLPLPSHPNGYPQYVPNRPVIHEVHPVCVSFFPCFSIPPLHPKKKLV
jgi:hypothetical protein